MIDTRSPAHSLFTRNPRNPLLTAADWPHTVNAVFNPGAVRLKDGTTLLLCRVEDRRGISSLWAARSSNGVDNWEIDPEPTLAPEPEKNPEEVWGVEDPRIVWLEEIGKYAITYTAYSQTGPAVSLALTEDFRAFERLGLVMPPEDKDAALVPRRYGGRWLMIHRPVYRTRCRRYLDVGISRPAALGPAPAPAGAPGAAPGGTRTRSVSRTPLIETDRGWLMLYHGVRDDRGRVASTGWASRSSTLATRAGACCAVTNGFSARASPTSARATSADVVFPCGYTLGDDGDTFNIYYGAADTCIGLATGRISEILSWLDTHGEGGSEHSPII